MSEERTLYDDGRIACTETSLVIRWYYLWGTKTIPYASIRSVVARPLTRWRGRWRIWGSGDLVHWYNLDPNRPKKDVAIEIVTGARVLPVVTPDDPQAVLQIVTSAGCSTIPPPHDRPRPCSDLLAGGGERIGGDDGGARRTALRLLYVAAMIAVIVAVDVLLVRGMFWERLIANVAIVVIFAGVYSVFLRS